MNKEDVKDTFDAIQFYRQTGYDGSLDFMFLNSCHEYMLSFPNVYFKLTSKEVTDKPYTPTVYKKVDFEKFISTSNLKLKDVFISLKYKMIELNIPDTYIHNGSFFINSKEAYFDYTQPQKKERT